MTLDEAIKHCEEVAKQKTIDSENKEFFKNEYERIECRECAEEHRQLAGWLRELKAYRLQEYTNEQYRADMKKLLQENGLHEAVKIYCDKIDEETAGFGYLMHRTVQEYLCDILMLIEMEQNNDREKND